MNGIRILVDGNIGAGKSTYLQIMKDYPHENVEIVPEPLSIWRDSGLFDLYYKDPAKWAFPFQLITYLSRLGAAARPLPQGTNVSIVERSVIADNKCFAQSNYESGNMTDMEWHAYGVLYGITIDKLKDILSYDKVIYLRATPEACMRRIKSRARDAEVGIDINYLRQLHSKYESWLMSAEMVDKVHVVNLEDDMESMEAYTARVHNDFKSVIENIRK
jgi:deoxyadenosine/deoxycytidine kinase